MAPSATPPPSATGVCMCGVCACVHVCMYYLESACISARSPAARPARSYGSVAEVGPGRPRRSWPGLVEGEAGD